MAVKLIFNINREMMRFVIVNRNVFYTDRKMAAWLQCLPKPDGFITRIKMSRNKIPAVLIDMFEFTVEEQKEYDNAKGDTEISDIIVRDCKIKGATLMLRTEVNDSELDDMKIIR